MGSRYFDVDVTLIITINTVVRTEGPGGVEYRVAGEMRGVLLTVAVEVAFVIPATRAGSSGAGHARSGH